MCVTLFILLGCLGFFVLVSWQRGVSKRKDIAFRLCSLQLVVLLFSCRASLCLLLCLRPSCCCVCESWQLLSSQFSALLHRRVRLNCDKRIYFGSLDWEQQLHYCGISGTVATLSLVLNLLPVSRMQDISHFLPPSMQSSRCSVFVCV